MNELKHNHSNRNYHLDNAECENYNELDYHRSVNDKGKFVDGKNDWICDYPGNSPDWKGWGWYRFTGHFAFHLILK